jgi:hypothetical protein
MKIPGDLQQRLAEKSCQLKTVFDKQERLVCLRQELSCARDVK